MAALIRMGMQDSTRGYSSYPRDLSDLLRQLVITYEQERELYWKGGDPSAEINPMFKEGDDYGRLIFDHLVELAGSDEAREWAKWFNEDYDALQKGFEGYPRGYGIDEVVERLQLEVAKQFDIRAQAKRCLELASLIISNKPGEAVLRFLRKLSRCYVLGLNAECVILCRAVFENALKEKFDEEDIPFPAGENGKSQVGSAIKMATRSKWFSPVAVQNDWPWKIWELGSKAVHYDPEAYRDPLGMIKMTLHVLSDLYGRTDQTQS